MRHCPRQLLKAHITSNSLLYTLLQVLHGIFQSAGWPTCVRLLSSWITTNRGFVTGIWTTCQSLGGILGALLATHFLGDGVHHGTWHTAYTIHVPIILFWALVVYMTITDAPPHASKDETVRMRQDEETGNRSKTHGKSKKGALPLKDVIAIPGVLPCAAAYFFLKFLRYALLLWLPFYFHDGLGFDKSVAGYLSTTFEIGGLVGTPLIGFISDKLMRGNGARTSGWFMALAACCLLLDEVFAKAGVTFNACVMAMIGVLVIGPDSVLSGTIAQTIGGGNLDGATVGIVAGFINSVGSAGSIL